MSCNIQSSDLYQVRDTSKSPVINTSFIEPLLDEYDNSISGIWLPLVVKYSDSETEWCDLLSSASLENNSKFDPAACSNDIFGQGDRVSDIFNAQEKVMDDLGECGYCSSSCESNPCDMKKDDNNPNKKFCDVRFNVDDYVPKIPYVYQGYISGFNDFKHLGEFPSVTNRGLGCEKFITMDVDENQFSVDGGEKKIYIDWKLQESISEIPYDEFSSQHQTEYIHNKSFTKSKMNKTCGNFLQKSGLLEGKFPNPQDYGKPYGFANQTYDNLYQGRDKIGSHWKWNYNSGIMGWYRHFDTERTDDKRPVKGIDLYIPPGDIFYAKNKGPEVSDSEDDSFACPSGLKIVNGTNFDQIIPNDTDFVYISSNIYPHFLRCRERISDIISDEEEVLSKSVLLATHPEYDNIVTDLYGESTEERNNVVGKLSTLNQFMTSGTDFVSAGNLNYCRTTDDLVRTLLHKYGCYYFIDSNTDNTIVFNSTTLKEGESFSADLSFDMVIKDKSNRFNLTSSYGSTDNKFLPNRQNYLKKFEYDEYFGVGDTMIGGASHNELVAYNESCDEGEFESKDEINLSALYLYGPTIATLSNNSGQYSFTDLYQGGNLQHDRIYPATAFNPHIDLIAVHPQGGAYINSLPFGAKQSTYFKKDVNSSPGGKIYAIFETKDCGIKIYNLSIKRLQSVESSSKLCERFPYSQEEKCKCYGFNLANRFEGRSLLQDTSLTIGNQFYVPNLSTENSPTLKTYGGYSKDYLEEFFGNGISSTQLSLAEKDVQDVSSYIDPLAPYGAEQSESLILPNYINDRFTVNTKNMDSSKHIDIIVSVNENVSLTANRFSGDPSNDEYTSNHNMSWKRFTTKVEVKNKVLYSRQSDEINVNEGDSFTIKLTNPFLAALINDTENSYAPPDNSVNLTSFMPALFSSRGDETSAVTLTFTRRPKKHLLNFVIPPPNTYGSLEDASFNPNEGLSLGSNGKSPFINNKLYYDYWFDEGGEEKLEDNKALLTGNTQDNMKKLCHQISDFKLNRKLRLYLGFGGGGKYYKVNRASIGKHVVNNKEYIGRPLFFEYIKSRINSQNTPMIYPAPPKKLFAWNFLFNHADINKDSVTTNLHNTYPQINGRDFNIDRDFLTFGGSRYYFAVEEIFEVVNLSKTSTNPEFPEEVFEDPLESIEDIVDGGIENLPEKAGIIIKIKELYYFYNGGPNNKVNSYILLGKTFEEILSNSSNLEIDYIKDLSETGYVYNTLRDCDHPIIVYINNKGLIIPNKERYKIIKKELRIQGYNDDNQPTILNPVKYRLYTRLKLNQDLGKISNKVFAVDISNKDNNASLCVFHTDNTTDYSNLLRVDENSPNSRRVKWSHLKNLTDPDDMTDLIVEDLSIKSRFPPSPYNNWFYKQIINNFEPRCNFQLYIRNTLNGTINFDKYYYYSDIDPSYCILQKYNLQKASVLPLKDAFLYQNFIPMMDINLFNPFGSNPDFAAMRASATIGIQEGFYDMVTKPPSFTNAGAFFGASPQVPEEIAVVGRDASNIGIPIEGLIYSPNWSRELSDQEFYTLENIVDPPELGGPERFWTEIEEDDTIETAYYPKSTIYSDTLRIDDPTFWLDKVTNETTFNSAGVSTIFRPTVPSMSSAGERIRGFEHTIHKRDYAFRVESIYGDGDKITECGAQGSSSCFISTRGNVSSYAHLKIATPTETSKLPGRNPAYFVTYDAGLYNPLGQKNLITINRAELDVDNPLDSAFDNCSTEYIRPSYTRTVFDPEKNETIKKAAKREQSSSVDRLDAYANEMLFRIMYGDEPDPINRNILLSKKKPLSIDDLVNFTDPKVTAADVYDEILYNYDTKAGCGDFVNNSFSVNGTSNAGDSYNLDIGNTSIYIQIVDRGGDNGVWAVGSVGTESIEVRLSARPTTKTGMRVTDVNTTLSNTDTTTYTYKKTSRPGKGKLHGYIGARVYTGQCTYTYNGMCPHLQGLVQWGSYPDEVSTLYSTSSEILTEHWLNPNEANLYDVEIENCAGSGPRICGGNPHPSFRRNQCSSPYDPTCPDDTCNDYEIGYCRRKEDCADKTGCYTGEELDNFLYTFEQCRTTFHVYGHSRKKLATGTPELDDEDTEQLEPDACGGNCPEAGPRYYRFVRDEDGNMVYDSFGSPLQEPDPDTVPEYYGCLDLAGGKVTLIDGNLGGGWRGSGPWVRGSSRSLCGGGSPNSDYKSGGNGGFGYYGRGGSMALINGPQMPQHLLDCPKDRQYSCYLWPCNQEVAKWQGENLINPCNETTDSPISMDPGYDRCGTVARYGDGPTFKYYTFEEVTEPVPYNGSCPKNLLTVKYTNQSVTVTINGEDICTSSSQAGCPELRINSIPEHSYISSETINNDGGDEANIEINIPPQTQNYQTIRYRHKEYLTQIAGADVNYVSYVGTQAGICNRSMGGGGSCCESQATAVCGEDAAPWVGTFAEGGTVPDSYGTWGVALEAWKEMCRNTFNDIDMEPTSQSWFMPGFKLTQGTVTALVRPRRLCNANRHISSSDIVQGIVPGTCGSLQFETTYRSYTRWRVANGGGYDTADGSHATVKAYIEYDYIRPATIQDKLKGWSPGSDSYACAQEGASSNARDEYPDWYARLLRVETSIPGYFFNYDNQQNKGGVSNYIRRKQTITRASYCGDSLTTYDPEDYNKDGDRSYPFGGAPCGRDDYLCWAANRDWISVWME